MKSNMLVALILLVVLAGCGSISGDIKEACDDISEARIVAMASEKLSGVVDDVTKAEAVCWAAHEASVKIEEIDDSK